MEAIMEGMRVALCTLCTSTPQPGSTVHINNRVVLQAKAGTMSKGGTQGENFYMPPWGKPATSNNNLATQLTASASEMAV